MTKTKWMVLAAISTLGGCGGAPAEPTLPATQPSATPVVSSASAAVDGGAPDAEATPAAAPKPAITFHLLAKSEALADLVPLGDKLFVRGGSIALALVEGDRVVEDERYGKGLEGFIGVRGLFGKWPDDAWAAITLSNGRVGWGGLRKWNGQSWALSGADLGQRWIYADVAASGQGLLALMFNVMPYDTNEPVRFKWVGPKSGGKLPVPTKAACGTLVRASAFTALSSGEVFTVGATCDDDKLAVEWWAPGETQGHVERLQGPSPYNDAYVLARKKDDVWVIGDAWKSATTAHFDGAGFQVVDNPFQDPVLSASLGPDGTLWVVASSTFSVKNEDRGDLFRRAAKGAWEKVVLPAGVKTPTSVYAASDGVVWLVADKNLYRSLPPKTEPQVIRWDYDQQFPASVRIPKPATEGCKDIFVLMYGITKVTPKDYDFPLTRKALQGHTELAGARFAETEDNGKRYFGAFVPTLALGKKIEKLVREKVKGSQPAVLCNRPKILRELEIDLATGEVKR
ncbi:MAG: hypothetical protein U0263_04665 [Polyangiaceae bacterium]